MRASVFLDFKTTGAAQAAAAVRGIVNATQKAANDSKKAQIDEKARIKANENALKRLAQVISETAKAKSTAEKRAAAESLKAQKAADREAMASSRARAREDERWSERRLQAVRRLRMEEERAARQRGRQIDRGIRNLRRGAVQTVAGVATVAATGVDAVRGFGSTLGVRSREEMIQRTMGFERGLIRLSGQAGLTDEQRAATRERILDVSRRTQADPNDILAAATTAQNRFSDFEFFAQNAERFAQASNALDVPMEDIVGAVGEFRRQMGITAEQVPELIGAMTSAAQQGSIEFSDVSAEFASAIGTYSRVTGQTGMQGAREFLAGAEVLGTGGQSGSQSAVLMQNLLAKLASADVQREMRQRGITTTRDGQFVGLANLVEQLSQNRRTDTPTELQGVFGRDMQANQAIGILISQFRDARSRGAANPLVTLANSNAEAGNATIDRTQAALLDSTSGRARQIGVNAEIEFMQNGDALIQSMTSMAGPLSELEARFPRVAQGLETFQGALTNLLAVFAGLRLAGGGAVLASGINAGTGTALAGTAAGGATGGAGLTAGGGLPLLLAGIAGLGIGTEIWEMQEAADMRRAHDRNTAARDMGAQSVRYQLQDMSNWRGVYSGNETAAIGDELENARRMLNGSDPGGAGLASVLQKIRDIGADDDLRSTAAGRETVERAEAQVARDRALQEQTQTLVRTQIDGVNRMLAGIATIAQPAPATGSTTEPTR